MDRQSKIDFLNRYKEGQAVLEELDQIIILVNQPKGYYHLKTGKQYSESEVADFKIRNICLVVIEEEEVDC